MLEVGELVTLAVACVTAAYVVTRWRSICAQPTTRAFLGPFLLLGLAWIATVAEDIFWVGPGWQIFIFGRETLIRPPAPPLTMFFHLTEHAAYAVAGIWFFLLVLRAVRRASKSRRGDRRASA
jgi:hypothetical protein